MLRLCAGPSPLLMRPYTTRRMEFGYKRRPLRVEWAKVSDGAVCVCCAALNHPRLVSSALCRRVRGVCHQPPAQTSCVCARPPPPSPSPCTQKMEVSNKNQVPTTTLFVVNFDVRKVRETDIERYFDRCVCGWRDGWVGCCCPWMLALQSAHCMQAVCAAAGLSAGLSLAVHLSASHKRALQGSVSC